MFLLDNDAFKLVVAGEPNTMRRVRENVVKVYLSSVAAEELIIIYLSQINRARSPRNLLSLPRAHQDFTHALDDLRLFPLFAYSDQAEAIYQTFSPATLRVGTQDCRIAAQALAHGLTVITRNLRDFEAIGATCADWSA